MAAPKRVPVPPARPVTPKQPSVPPRRPAPDPAPGPGPAKPTPGTDSKTPAKPRATTPPASPKSGREPRPVPRARPRRDGKLRVLIAGASGLIGTELQTQLTSAGHEVLTLVRREPQKPNEYTWAPDAKIVDFRLFDDVDAVINLSGASLNRLPWTKGYREQIRRSRVKATQALVDAMAMVANPPSVFISGSAVGIYGDRPGERLTDDAARGSGFLSDVVEAWEAAALLAPDRTRTVLARTGVVLAPSGGALDPLRLLTRLGISGPLGTGSQHWPWISLHDEAAALVHLLTSKLDGPVNLAGPAPATADRIGSKLAQNLHRPFALRVPEKIIEFALRDAGRELLLSSQDVVPERLLADGFVFRHETSDAAIDEITKH